MMLISMIGYLLLIVAIGILFGKHNKTSEEFYIGGRGLGPWVTAMSAEASDMSGWLLMGLPGLAYATGLADAAWTAVGLALGTYLNWVFTARPLRIYTQVAKNSITVPDYFSNRFHDSKKILMNIAALFILLFFVVYTASGFVACGKLFASLFGFNYAASMVVSAIIVVVYTVVGGFLAESVVDFVQGTLMFVVLITIVTIGANAAGGFAQVIADGSAREGYLSLFQINSLETGAALNFDIVRLGMGIGLFWYAARLATIYGNPRCPRVEEISSHWFHLVRDFAYNGSINRYYW